MKEHVSGCKHYSIYEPFRTLKMNDVIFGRGFMVWTNFFHFLSGQTHILVKKQIPMLKAERKQFYHDPPLADDYIPETSHANGDEDHQCLEDASHTQDL